MLKFAKRNRKFFFVDTYRAKWKKINKKSQSLTVNPEVQFLGVISTFDSVVISAVQGFAAPIAARLIQYRPYSKSSIVGIPRVQFPNNSKQVDRLQSKFVFVSGTPIARGVKQTWLWTQTLHRELSHQLPEALYNIESSIIIRKFNAFVNTYKHNCSLVEIAVYTEFLQLNELSLILKYYLG